jgi:hypothetical protein
MPAFPIDQFIHKRRRNKLRNHMALSNVAVVAMTDARSKPTTPPSIAGIPVHTRRKVVAPAMIGAASWNELLRARHLMNPIWATMT